MDLFIQGKGRVRLTQADFVARGGEGAVYAKGDVAYKVYTDFSRAISPAKIRELAVLDRPAILRPREVLLDGDHRVAGYTMRRVQDAQPLCRLFTRAFRERQAITPARVTALVRKLQEGVEYVHRQGMLIVDLNEMNFLLDASLQEVLFIDVDSYQTPGFPATALMDSIRDRHASGFSRETDWFSFGIVSFQMFVGIHPYRGKHPTLADLDTRMQANASVLDPCVTLPQSCYPLDTVPRPYLEWYRELFQEGKRLPPPDDGGAAPSLCVSVPAAPAGDRLRVAVLQRLPAHVVSVLPTGAGLAVLTSDGLHVNGRRHAVPTDARLALSPRLGHIVAAWARGGRLVLFDGSAGRAIEADLRATSVTVSEGRLYVHRGEGLCEVEFIELPGGLRAALKAVGNALEHATHLYDGLAVQSLLGSCYVSLFPRSGSCYPVRLPELDPYRIVDGRFERGVLMLAAEQHGRYDRFVLRFAPDYRTYDLRRTPDVTYAGLNFVVLENGVCVHLAETEELELFPARKDAPERRVVKDAGLAGARLFKDGTRLLFSRGKGLYAATLRE